MRSVVVFEGQGWAFQSLPLSDELLSSYLVRAAHRHGASPYGFFAHHFPGMCVWNRDIDRSANAAFLDRLVQLSGVGLEGLRQLRIPQPADGGKTSAGLWPWVNTVGVYHRKRRGFGLAFCPLCLSESAHYRRLWRHSAITVCERHECDLHDGCPACGEPLAPHRQRVNLVRCGHCSADLRKARMTVAGGGEGRIRWQHMLARPPASLAGFAAYPVSGTEFQRGARILVQVFAAARIRRSISKQVPSLTRTAVTALERCRLSERSVLMDFLAQVLEDWPDAFVRESLRLGMAQPSFPMMHRMPAWLAGQVACLPVGQRWRFSQATGHGSLAARLEALSLSGDADWRSQRAKRLLRAVRGRQR